MDTTAVLRLQDWLFINVVPLKGQKIVLNLQVKVAILDPWTKQKMYALYLFLERILDTDYLLLKIIHVVKTMLPWLR